MSKNKFEVEIERLQALSAAYEETRRALTEDQLAKLKVKWKESDEDWKVQEDMTHFDDFLAKCSVGATGEDDGVDLPVGTPIITVNVKWDPMLFFVDGEWVWEENL